MTQSIETRSDLTIGLDVGDRTTHVCVIDDARAIVYRSRFPTRRADLLEALAPFPRGRVILEAGSQSPWMSAALLAAGFAALVVDPRRVALISKDRRKTDRRDAETLARLGAGIPELLGDVHHRDEQTQADLSIMRARDLVVRMRTQVILQVRGLCKAFGERLPSASTPSFARRVAEEIPEILRPAVLPLLEALRGFEETIRGYDALLAEVAEARYPAAARLRAVNGVGAVTSVAYVLTLADPVRFKQSRQVGSWLGLCPINRASGDSAPSLPISKAGDAYLRRLLVQCGQYILGPFGQDSDLRRFGLRLADRGGAGAKKRAVVAVARKLAVLLHRLWVSGETYEPLRNAAKDQAVTAA